MKIYSFVNDNKLIDGYSKKFNYLENKLYVRVAFSDFFAYVYATIRLR